MSIEKFDADLFEEIGTEWALVSAGDEGRSNTMTIGWGGVGNIWGKKAVFVFIRESRYTKEFMDKGETFSVAFMGDELRSVHKVCGSKSGRDCDKWNECNMTPVVKNGCVYPKEAKLALLCRKMAAVPMGADTFTDPEVYPKWYPDNDMHVMYVCEIVDVIKG